MCKETGTRFTKREKKKIFLDEKKKQDTHSREREREREDDCPKESNPTSCGIDLILTFLSSLFFSFIWLKQPFSVDPVQRTRTRGLEKFSLLLFICLSEWNEWNESRCSCPLVPLFFLDLVSLWFLFVKADQRKVNLLKNRRQKGHNNWSATLMKARHQESSWLTTIKDQRMVSLSFSWMNNKEKSLPSNDLALNLTRFLSSKFKEVMTFNSFLLNLVWQ